MNRHPLLAFLLLALLAGACAVGPDFKPPPAHAPPAWAGVTNAAQASPSATTSAPADLTAWWKKFNDSTLVSLIDEALRTNLSLQLAQSRLRQARASRGIVAGPFWPSLAANGSYTRGANGTAPSKDTFLTGLDAAWELDFFGGTR